MKYFLGIDLGTSYFKAGIFDEDGVLKGLGRELVRKREEARLCELPVAVFWETLKNCVGKALITAGIAGKEICAVSYSSQANSFILLDRADNPLSPLILWPDERSGTLDKSVLDLTQRSDFRVMTGIGVDPNAQFGIVKIRWFQEKHPEIWRQVKRIMTISDYLVFSLTDQKVGDFSTAALTGLLNTPGRKWWDEALDSLNIDNSYLSQPLNVGTHVGALTSNGARQLGLPPGASFFLGSLDHHMAAIGAGVPGYNTLSESTGTVLACVNYQDGYFPEKKVCIAPGWEDGHFFQMAFGDNGAASLEWYQMIHAPEKSIVELLDLAARIDVGSDGLIALPGANKYPGLSGFENIKKHHTHGHFVRAILECTSMSLYCLTNRITPSTRPRGIVPTGGGARSILWIQIKANLLDHDFFIPGSGELACKGAAMLGAAGKGTFKNINEAIRIWIRAEQIIKPEKTDREKYRKWRSELKNPSVYDL